MEDTDQSTKPIPKDTELEILKEEWKHIESIVARHINMAFKVRAWFLTLITALMIGLFSQKIVITALNFYILSFLVLISFLFMELQQRLYLLQAMNRSSEIEKMLRGEVTFDSPRISDSFTASHTLKSYIKVFRSNFVLIPYVCILFLIAFTGLALEYLIC